MHQNWGTADDGGEECRWSALQQKQPAAEQSTTRAQNCAHAQCAAEMQIEHAAFVFTNTIRNSCIELKPQTESDQVLDLEEKDLRSADQSWLPTPAAALSKREMYGRSRWTNHRRCYSDVGTSVKSVCGPKLSASRGSSVRGGDVWKTGIDVTTTADTADIFSMQNANVRSDKSKLD